MPHFTFQSYAWSLGTTSFRMADFHRKVEEQLMILNDFWNVPENHDEAWESNSTVQCRYYEYAYECGFITGELQAEDSGSRAKTARQKTSGLVDIGLINDNRRLTEVGLRLLNLAQTGDFSSDNEFQIPSDSFLYLKQIMKTSCPIQNGYVRPFLVTGKVLRACDNYLTDDEFTYLLPLCVDEDTTEDIIEKIHSLREGQTTISRVIIETVLPRYSYPAAVDYLVHSDKSANDIMIAGMNRKSPNYDAPYAVLYAALLQIYINHDQDAVDSLIRATKAIKNRPGTLWRALLFDNPRSVHSIADLNATEFDSVTNETQLARRFFTYMHLYKIMSNLLDYKDLNRRYLNITDAFIFEDGQVKFSPMFENFFETEACLCFDDAYSNCSLLTNDVSMQQINEHLLFDETEVISVFNENSNTDFDSIEQVYGYLESERYQRFRHLIDTRFSDEKIISVLKNCEDRDSDDELIEYFGGEADVPTIFEYIVAVAWYKMSEYRGKILDYMNLSINNELLPRTHAGGGESDIVYEYETTNDYPEHTLLIECTLMEGTTQRHGEMEPVSRHLSNYMIDNDANAYCAFVANNLHASVISDFRGRKSIPYYRNDNEHVDSMKIIPLHTRELRTAIEKNLKYRQIYRIFDDAFTDTNVAAPPEWYNVCVKAEIDSM